jgi:hypothetical protein
VIRPGEPWFDTDGNVIDAHGAGMLLVGDTYYWYGSRRNHGMGHMRANRSCCSSGGISLYTSKDLYRWKHHGVVLAPFNDSRADSTQNGLDLERPKVVFCRGTGKYTMWVRGTGRGNTPQLLAVATADSPMGPFLFKRVNLSTKSPFHTVNPGNRNLLTGYQYADATLFQDPKDPRRIYVYWRTRVNPQIPVSELWSSRRTASV